MGRRADGRETYRLDGALDVAETLVERGLDVARQARYWYAVGFAERIAGRIARDRGCRDESAAAFDRAASLGAISAV
jgi:hypothetical protein